MTHHELQARLHAVRSHYRVTPWIQPRDDEAPLLRSWQRCLDAGMREGERVNFEMVSRAWLAELADHHGDLVHRARPETERLAQALRGTGCTVLLFNTRGVVIDRLCHEAATPATLLTASRVGINVSERCVGTTAPAIALAEGMPYLVGRDAHFFANTRPFFCVAAPIDDPQGERLAALDITSYDSVPAFDVMSLVVDAAAAIENALFRPARDRLVVHFHPRAELVGTALEALLLVDEQGQVCGANRMAGRLLCRPRSALLGRPFGELFDRRVRHLFGGAGRVRDDLVDMMTPDGLQVLARFEGESAAVGASRMGARMLHEVVLHTPDASDDATGRLPAGHGPAVAEPPAPALPASMREVEIQTIRDTLAALGGNVSAAARQLGISRNTIYRRLQSLPQPGAAAGQA